MADKIYEGAVEVSCIYCRGSGSIPAEGGGYQECRYCGGDGFYNIGNIALADMQADITKCLRRLKKIMDKLEVLDD